MCTGQAQERTLRLLRRVQAANSLLLPERYIFGLKNIIAMQVLRQSDADETRPSASEMLQKQEERERRISARTLATPLPTARVPLSQTHYLKERRERLREQMRRRQWRFCTEQSRRSDSGGEGGTSGSN